MTDTSFPLGDDARYFQAAQDFENERDQNEQEPERFLSIPARNDDVERFPDAIDELY